MKRGITLASIGITILVMLVLMVSVTMYSVQISEQITKTKFVTEYYLLQDAVDEYYEKYEYYPVNEEQIITITENMKTTNFFAEEEYIVDNKLNLAKVNLSELQLEGLNYGNEKSETDYYYLSRNTGILYYLEGVIINNVKYYRVTNNLNSDVLRDIATSENDVVRYECVFSLNTLEKTNQAVTMQVKVPTACSITSITASDAVTCDAEMTTQAQYNYINVNTNNERTNYYVKVVYVGSDGISREVQCNVTNFENY